MRRAFLGPLGVAVDIFAVARNLAEGGEPPEELMKDPISRKDFLKEVEVSPITNTAIRHIRRVCVM